MVLYYQTKQKCSHISIYLPTYLFIYHLHINIFMALIFHFIELGNIILKDEFIIYN